MRSVISFAISKLLSFWEIAVGYLRRGAKMLTLSEAIKANRLDEFIRQQEAAGVGPVDERLFFKAARRVIKPEPQSDQTSRSASRGGSTGK